MCGKGTPPGLGKGTGQRISGRRIPIRPPATLIPLHHCFSPEVEMLAMLLGSLT